MAGVGGRGSCRAGSDPDALGRARLGRSLALPPVASPGNAHQWQGGCPRMDEPKEKLAQIAADHGVGCYARHVFLCIGPDCCTEEEGRAAWDVLKRELKDRKLSLGVGPNACYRTKVQCLRICSGGPILVVYPEGAWYPGLRGVRFLLCV